MSDVLQELTLNGETTRAMLLGGSGSHVADIDDFSAGLGTGTIAASFRHVWKSPAATPVLRPAFFVGLCADGKPYAAGNSHAYGTLMFSSSFSLDPFTFTDNGFFTSMFPYKSVGGVQTGLGAGYAFWMNRYEKAAGTQPYQLQINGGAPTWLWKPTSHDGAFNSVTMNQAEFDAGLTARLPTVTVTSWITAYSPGSLTHTTGVTFPTPDEVTHGVLNKLNLWWDFPSGHSMYLHSLTIKRLAAV
jgi:hypothetical protein